MIVEDNTINRKLTQLQVENFGYDADVAANGLEALAALARHPYALVLMDCQMPEMDGFAATTAIRANEGTQRHTPIIALTANALQGEHERCLRVGMDDYLTKPIKPEALAATLECWSTPAHGLPVTAAPNEQAELSEPLAPAPLAYLRGLWAGAGQNVLTELINLFLAETPQRLAGLRTAIAQGQAEEAGKLAHLLKGSSGVLDARHMAALCLQLEKQARTTDLNQSASLLAPLEEEYARIRGLLETELQRSSSAA